jgi:hypothetical protein
MPAVTRATRAILAAAAAVALSLLAPGHAAAQAPSFLVADLSHGAAVRAWPGGPVTGRLSAHTALGSPRVLWLLDRDRRGRWGRAVLPLKPNGTTGWVDLRSVPVHRTSIWVVANIGARRVTLMRGNRPLASFPSAIGAAGSPTPTGRFSVTDLVATGDPSGPFGWFAFGLSGHQMNLPAGWSGGDQLAIHGTNSPSSIGRAASAGCLRITARALARLRAAVTLGTPVFIVRNAAAARIMARRASVTAWRKPRVRPAASATPAPIVLIAPPGRAAGAAEHGPLAGPSTGDRQPADRSRRPVPLLLIGLLPVSRPSAPLHRVAPGCRWAAGAGARPPPGRARARAPTALR